MAGNPRDERRRLERRAARGDAASKAKLIDLALARLGVTEDDISCFVSGFLEKALWHEQNDEGDFLDESYRISDFSDGCWDMVTRESREFIAAAGDDVLEALGRQDLVVHGSRCERWHGLGGVFYMTRRGSGSDFRDFCGRDLGGRLNVAANPFPEVMAFEGGDGVYLDKA